jgi:hypothetical protein
MEGEGVDVASVDSKTPLDIVCRMRIFRSAVPRILRWWFPKPGRTLSLSSSGTRGWPKRLSRGLLIGVIQYKVLPYGNKSIYIRYISWVYLVSVLLLNHPIQLYPETPNQHQLNFNHDL